MDGWCKSNNNHNACQLTTVIGCKIVCNDLIEKEQGLLYANNKRNVLCFTVQIEVINQKINIM